MLYQILKYFVDIFYSLADKNNKNVNHDCKKEGNQNDMLGLDK